LLNIGDFVTGSGCIHATDQARVGCTIRGVPPPGFSASVHFDICLAAEISVWAAGAKGEACARYVEYYDFDNMELGEFIRIDYNLHLWLFWSEWKHSAGIYPSAESNSCSNNRWAIWKFCRHTCDDSSLAYYQYLGGKLHTLNPNPRGRTYAGDEMGQHDWAAHRSAKGRARLRQ